MKKEKIYAIITTVICFSLLFMPLENTKYAYAFTIRLFIEGTRSGELSTVFLGELLTMILGIITITLLIVHFCIDKLITKIIATASSFAYVIVWLVHIFASFPLRISIYMSLRHGASIIWLILYFVMLLAILILQTLQYTKYFPPHRPTKAERLQQQVDDLQKQIDELKKGE